MVNIVFVDDNDQVVGAGSKQQALENGYIVGIIRIFLLNSRGEVLLQKRSQTVAAPGLWDQSVGGHVDEGESYIDAAHREMREELGVEGVELQEVMKYRYDASLVPGSAKRFNMLYTGGYDGAVHFNTAEVEAIRWVMPGDLAQEFTQHPDQFTKGAMHAFRILQDRGTFA